MAVGGDSQAIDAATPIFTAKDPEGTVADPGNATQAWIVGTAVGMNPRIDPARHGFEFDVW